MTALRRRKILAALLKLAGKKRRMSSADAGPGCSCDSCVQAWHQHHPTAAAGGKLRGMRPGLD